MKIQIPKTIGEVNIPNIPARTAFERGLVEGWKAGYQKGLWEVWEFRLSVVNVEFIEGEE